MSKYNSIKTRLGKYNCIVEPLFNYSHKILRVPMKLFQINKNQFIIMYFNLSISYDAKLKIQNNFMTRLGYKKSMLQIL